MCNLFTRGVKFESTSTHMEVAESSCFGSHQQFWPTCSKKHLFIRPITALHCRWKYVVLVLSIWRVCRRHGKCLQSTFRPLSVWMLTGSPKRLVQCSSSAVAIISAVWIGNTTVLYSFVIWSQIDATYLLQFEPGSGPKRSKAMWTKEKLEVQSTKLCLRFCLGLLRCCQTRQLETTTVTFVVCPSRKNLVKSIFKRFCNC